MIFRAYHPDNHVVGAIRRRDKRRAAAEPTASVYTPSRHKRRWIGCVNAESRELVLAGATSNIRSLVSTVRGRPLVDRLRGDIEGIYRRSDAAEVVPIKPVRMAIFPQCNHEMGRCRTGHIH